MRMRKGKELFDWAVAAAADDNEETLKAHAGRWMPFAELMAVAFNRPTKKLRHRRPAMSSNLKPFMNKNKASTPIVSSVVLGGMDESQLINLSVGLTRNFGTTLMRPDELGGDIFILETEGGTRMGVAAGCTVQDVWNIAEAAFMAGGVPKSVGGVRNVMPPYDRTETPPPNH